MLADPPISDGELAARVAAGASAALENELARRFAPRIRLYGLKHLRDEDRARDLTQEVLLVVIEALRAGKVEDPALVDRFVLGVCRNVCLAWQRGERRRRDLAGELGAALEPSAWPAAPPAAPDVKRLMGCVAGLPLRERSVLVLSYCEDETAEAIGAALGLSPGNVRVLRHRALARVRDCVTGGAAAGGAA